MEDNIVPAQGAIKIMDTEAITPDYYVQHYMEFLPRYISKGRPRPDTLHTYHRRISLFIDWCRENQRHPLTMHDYQMRIYMDSLINSHKDSTVALSLIAIRAFFMVAKRIGLIKENPCAYIHVSQPYRLDEEFKFFTVDQVQEILKTFDDEKNDFIRTRNRAMLYLMSVEGLRNVELMRMNDEDIDWTMQTIHIRGKGHDGVIYPSESTMNIMKEYIVCRPEPKKEGLLTPTFISNSHRKYHKRITRNGIRTVMNKALRLTNYKAKGISCHVFRHSCGTNLYAATKDLRIVQETLRQRDPKMAARYAHVQQRMSKRYTNALDPAAYRPQTAQQYKA